MSIISSALTGTNEPAVGVSAEELGLIAGYRALSAANKKIVADTVTALGRKD